MLNEMSRDVFQAAVKNRISRHLPIDRQIFFAWLCAVRSLPFTNIRRKLCYCKKSEIHNYLQSIFYAIDIAAYAANEHTVASSVAYAAADDASSVAYAYAYNTTYSSFAYTLDNASDVASAAAAAADTVAYAAAAVAAVSSAYAATSATTAATNAAATAAADAASASTVAYADNNYGRDYTLRFQDLILSDIEAIRTGIYSNLQNSTDIYGKLWQYFQEDLTAIGCGYWAMLYADIFTCKFQFNEKFMEDLKRRINVPAEVRKCGAVDVVEYLENIIIQGLVYKRRETRLIILGSAGAGKTTLVKRLNGELDNPEPKDSTHGVNTSVKLNCNGIKTHVWDFGGQVIYHASHRCFISENCIYILVVNARTEDNRDIGRIKYWLDTIRIYSRDKAKVFIIINESDNRGQNVEDYNSLKTGEYVSLIQEIYSFNIGYDIDSVNEFKKILSDYIETAGHQAFGQNDSHAIEKIKTLFDNKTQILRTDELESVLFNNGIKTTKDQKRAKELLNTLGVALSYDFIGSYVLDPYWISHGVYKVIDYLQKNKSMFINYNELDAVFADERSAYSDGKKEYILDLMEYHKIGFRNKGGVRGLTVPCVTSQFKPKDIIVDIEHDSIVTQVEREDLQEFPADFFYRYMCANENDIKKYGEKRAIWQTGMVLESKSASALVELIENRRIEITIWGESKNEYSKKLEMLITDMLQEYRFTSYAEDRKKGVKLVKVITLVLESAAKGVAKAWIEASFSGNLKP